MNQPRRFDPSTLRYDRDGVPILSEWDITDIALELLEAYFPLRLRISGPTPVLEIIQRLSTPTKLKYCLDKDLGERNGRKVLGKVNFVSRTLYLDPILQGELESALQFTAAHEIGHWILHRWGYKNFNFADANDFEDDHSSLCRIIGGSPRERLERQANIFAAELIMPFLTFSQAVEAAQRKLGIRRNIGTIVLTPGRESLRDYNATVSEVARTYNTSMAAVRVRLDTLHFVQHQDRIQAARDVPLPIP